MNKERLEGNFDQLKGEIKKKWGKLTDDEVAYYNGNADKFYGVIKEKYGIAKEDAEKNLKDMIKVSTDKAA